MKKEIILLIIAFIMFLDIYGQSNTMKVVRVGNQIGFLFSDNEGVYNDNFIFQYETKDESFIDKPTIETIQNVKYLFNNKSLIISFNNTIKTYTIADIKGDGVFNGFGLAHRVGKFILHDIQNQKSIFEIITVVGTNSTSRTLNCHSGGTGSNSCSIESPIIGGSCSVSCNEGYYACCDQSKNECGCVEIKKPIKGIGEIPKRIIITPNPVKETLYFTGENLQNYSIEIYDYSGNTVVSRQILSEEINISRYKKGLYLYKITDTQGNFQNGKIIKNSNDT